MKILKYWRGWQLNVFKYKIQFAYLSFPLSLNSMNCDISIASEHDIMVMMCLIDHALNINISDNNEPFWTFIYYVTLWRQFRICFHLKIIISFFLTPFFPGCFLKLFNEVMNYDSSKRMHTKKLYFVHGFETENRHKKYVIMCKWLWTKDRSIDDWRLTTDDIIEQLNHWTVKLWHWLTRSDAELRYKITGNKWSDWTWTKRTLLKCCRYLNAFK